MLGGEAKAKTIRPLRSWGLNKGEIDMFLTALEHTLQRKDGYSINAREFGLAYKGKKPSIVMLHGFPDNQHLYDLLVAQLGSSNHVVTFDFLGWGQSDKPGTHA